MKVLLSLLLFALMGPPYSIHGQQLPTVYEYYTEGGIQKGMEALPSGFYLNGKNISIHSGAMHYFRIHPAYWRDRLRKLRAAGLIAVETYVPWNLHEPEMGTFDFGDGNRDMSEFLDLRAFLKMAQEEDLLVIFRPGPYICAEWVMGGLPSWLLRIPGIKMRTSDPKYTERVKIFFDKLLPLVTDLQFTNNGSIIAVQVENEFSSVSYPTGPDDQHLKDLEVILRDNGIKELLFTSDNLPLPKGSIPGVLRTINFQKDPLINFALLKNAQPDLPAMVMEYWTGWYDHWFSDTSGRNDFTAQDFQRNLEVIMNYPSSVNFYMFIGGTSFGFMNGANAVIDRAASIFDITSYDYGAPLNEAGDYTEKYYIAKDVLSKYQPVQFLTPEMPENTNKIAYPQVKIKEYINLEAIYESSGPAISSSNVINMEDLPINNGSGQSYGYIWYRKVGLNISSGDTLKITGLVHDIAQVLVDGKLQSKVLEWSNDTLGFGYWRVRDGELILKDSGTTLDIIVENLGRVNFGLKAYEDRKGLYEGPVTLNEIDILDWSIVPLEFKKNWILGLQDNLWKPFDNQVNQVSPALYRGILTLPTDSDPSDTFILTDGWIKGLAFVNGFNLGRYNKVGPQLYLYVPAPLLKRGENEIIMFEQFIPSPFVSFSNEPVWI